METVKLAPHQKKAVRELHNGCILAGGVGVGKSRTAIRYYIEKEAPRDVYVITTAKKRDSLDWETEAVHQGIGTTSSIPVAGKPLGIITVDSWNNINKYIFVEDAFFIFDEQRVVGSGQWVKGFRAITKKNHWILLSATPGDTWLDYIPVFVANGFYKNRTEFLREHVVYNRFSKFPKIDRYIGVSRLVRHRHSLLVEMPYERHTTRHIHEIDVDYDKELFDKVVKQRWHVYEDRPLRDVAELFSVMRKVVNSDSARLEVISGLLQQHPKLIVFYNFDYELEMLRSLVAKPIEGKTNELRESFESWDGTRKIEKNTGQKSKSSEKTLKENAKLEESKCQPNECSSNSHPKLSTNLTGLSESIRKETRSSSNLDKMEEHGEFFDQSLEEIPTSHLESGSTTVKSGCSQSSLSSAPVLIAEWNGHKHEPIPKSDRWVYLVQYTAGAEGWNCVETDTMVFFSLTYSYRAFHQAQGRIDRLNTPFVDLNYYVLKSKSPIDAMIWKALKVKKKFNEPRNEEALKGRSWSA